MIFTKRMWKTGTGIVITVPKDYINEYGLEVGDMIEFEIRNHKKRGRQLPEL
jgi:hypothetical protein